jgi:hypothetical protein
MESNCPSCGEQSPAKAFQRFLVLLLLLLLKVLLVLPCCCFWTATAVLGKAVTSSQLQHFPAGSRCSTVALLHCQLPWRQQQQWQQQQQQQQKCAQLDVPVTEFGSSTADLSPGNSGMPAGKVRLSLRACFHALLSKA